MKHRLRFVLFACGFLLAASGFSQETHTGIALGPKKFKKHFAPGAAYSYSVINNRKEVRGQFKPGINVNLDYYTHSWFAWSAEYSYFFPHNSSPGLENIHAWNTELNGKLLMKMGESDLYFRTIFGLSYLNWKGTYVGPDVIDNNTWYYGKLLKQDWLAANIGWGFSHAFAHRFYGYADFRLRFASEKKDLVSISDTAFMIGVQWNPIGAGLENSTNADAKKKTQKGKKPGVYKWLKKR